MINLKNKKVLIMGIANESSIAYGCARALSESGAELCVTYANEKTQQHVEPLLTNLNAPLFLKCNVTIEEECQALFTAIDKQWGGLDVLLHSIAFSPLKDLHGRVTDCSRAGFLEAMDISCHSFIRMAKRAETLMKKGGLIATVSYVGSNMVIPEYGLMGPVKAALESVVKYLAYELGNKNIRVNAISPGPIKTRAASGIKNFDTLYDETLKRSMTHFPISIDEVGKLLAFLADDEASKNITGQIIYIDGGFNQLGTK
jgi:enoyl-[acyl-carrier protein] reductase I